MSRWIKRIIIALVLLAVLAGVGIYVLLDQGLGSLLKAAIEDVGPRVTGTTVSLRAAKLSPFSGEGELQDLVVGNTEGFDTPYSVNLGNLKIVVDPKSLSGDVITIKELSVGHASLICEQKLTKNNLKAILKNVEDFAAAIPAGESSQEPSQTKVIIQRFSFTNGQAKVKATGIAEADVPVPEVILEGIGQKEAGITVAEAIPQMVRPIIKAVFEALAGANIQGAGFDPKALAGDLQGKVGTVTKGATDAIKSGTENVKDAGKKAIEGVKNLNPFRRKE